MKDSDKVLINAYLDGETSTEESKRIEELLHSDSDAREYAEGLKVTNLEIDAFANDADQINLNKKVHEFVDSQIKPQLNLSQNSKSKLPFFENLFVRHAIGYSLTALLFVGIGSNWLNQTNYGLNDFTETKITSEYLKLRSGEVQTIEDLVFETTANMIDSKALNADIIWGDELYQVILNERKEPCYYGEVTHNEEKAQFAFCISGDSKNITFL